MTALMAGPLQQCHVRPSSRCRCHRCRACLAGTACHAYSAMPTYAATLAWKVRSCRVLCATVAPRSTVLPHPHAALRPSPPPLRQAGAAPACAAQHAAVSAAALQGPQTRPGLARPGWSGLNLAPAACSGPEKLAAPALPNRRTAAGCFRHAGQRRRVVPAHRTLTVVNSSAGDQSVSSVTFS